VSKGQKTKRNIIDMALGAASQLGLENVTIGQLAKNTKMSKSGLFAHFKSKEQLQIAIIQEAALRFVSIVVVPAVKKARGEPRVRALFENWLNWENDLPGGCVFLAAASELDDRPGPARDHLVHSQRDWLETIANAVRIAVEEGHFRTDLDCEQFAFEAEGLFFAHHFYQRLLRDEMSQQRLRDAFESLIARSRP